jgi:hypothetical protein
MKRRGSQRLASCCQLGGKQEPSHGEVSRQLEKAVKDIVGLKGLDDKTLPLEKVSRAS